MATVYLLHFDRPYISSGGKKIVSHYMGATNLDVEERMKRHKTERGAALLRAVTAAGIGWTIVRRWTTRNRKSAFMLEIKLKRRRNHREYCPVCGGKDGNRDRTSGTGVRPRQAVQQVNQDTCAHAVAGRG